MSKEFILNIDQVNDSIKKVKVQIEKIKEESDKLKKLNDKYRNDLKDQISEDADKWIKEIKADAERLYKHLEETNDIIKKSNEVLQENESNRIKV